MAETSGLIGGRMLTVAVAAEMVYQLVGSNMSSPQTAELNAPARAPTIGKWVKMTNWEALAWLVFLSYLSYLDGVGWWWPWVGGGIALVGMFLKYRYAIASGLRDGGRPTEDYT